MYLSLTSIMASPTAKILTINQFLQLPKENMSAYKIQICGKIVTEIENDSFCFADKDTVIDCKINSLNHLNSRFLKKDMYIKIVKPGREKLLTEFLSRQQASFYPPDHFHM